MDAQIVHMQSQNADACLKIPCRASSCQYLVSATGSPNMSTPPSCLRNHTKLVVRHSAALCPCSSFGMHAASDPARFSFWARGARTRMTPTLRHIQRFQATVADRSGVEAALQCRTFLQCERKRVRERGGGGCAPLAVPNVHNASLFCRGSWLQCEICLPRLRSQCPARAAHRIVHGR
jgi:hypothetical protein